MKKTVIPEKWLNQLSSCFESLLSAGVKLDPSKAWCPVIECQAVCTVRPSSEGQPTAVSCLTCHTVFCSGCRGPWQDGHTCPERQPMMPLPTPSHENRSVSSSSRSVFGLVSRLKPRSLSCYCEDDSVLKAGRVCEFIVEDAHKESLVTAVNRDVTHDDDISWFYWSFNFYKLRHVYSFITSLNPLFNFMRRIPALCCRMCILNGSYKWCVAPHLPVRGLQTQHKHYFRINSQVFVSGALCVPGH